MPVTPEQKREAKQALQRLDRLPEDLAELETTELSLQEQFSELQEQLSELRYRLSELQYEKQSLKEDIECSEHDRKKYEAVLDQSKCERQAMADILEKNTYAEECLVFLVMKIVELAETEDELEEMIPEKYSAYYDLEKSICDFREWLISNHKPDLKLHQIIRDTDHDIDAIIGLAHFEHVYLFKDFNLNRHFVSHRRSHYRNSLQMEPEFITYDYIHKIDEGLRDNINMPDRWWEEFDKIGSYEAQAFYTFSSNGQVVRSMQTLSSTELLTYDNKYGFSIKSRLDNLYWHIYKISFVIKEEGNSLDESCVLDEYDSFGRDGEFF